MKKSFLSAIIALAASVLCLVRAQNPYMPLWEFIPDGEPYVFEDPDNPGKFRVYVYGSHDMLRQQFCGRDQVVWSAPVEDLADWRLDGVIFESKTDANGKFLRTETGNAQFPEQPKYPEWYYKMIVEDHGNVVKQTF